MRNDKSLPELLLITPEPPADAGFDEFLERLDQALARGIALVQLRAKRLDPSRFGLLAARAATVCHQRGARLMLNGPGGEEISPRSLTLAARPPPGKQSSTDAEVRFEPGQMEALRDADGLHLTSVALMRASTRTLHGAKLLSAACHTEQQLAHAERIGVDFVTLSPVLPTASHPGAPTLGWARFGELVARTRVPVYALGGMTREHCERARALGAQGIAAITALW
jgi:thiamine monophosphate synthase